ncbi:MAG: hypothetical protein IPM96_17140 [Ignavibacteria bacterium]|nr:hypothetical protein [Ignavibacteria bacterium]
MKLKFAFTFLFLITFTCISFSQNRSGLNICEKWNALDEKIKTGKIEYDDAVEMLVSYEPE